MIGNLIAAIPVTPLVLGDYESIQTVTVGVTPVSTIEFTSIPATYQHLQIRAISRDNRAVTLNTLNMRVGNGSLDTGSNYSSHHLTGNGSAASAGAQTSGAQMTFMIDVGASATASIFSAHIIDILDYANTNKYSTFRALGGTDLNGSGQVDLVSGNWRNTAAITNIGFFTNGSGNFVEHSSFALYGIKG